MKRRAHDSRFLSRRGDFFQEPGYEALGRKLVAATAVGIGALTLVETAIVLSARLGVDARGYLARFIEENQMTVMPFPEARLCFLSNVRAFMAE